MTREDLKKQVLARVKLPAEFSDLGENVLEDWLKPFPEKYVFGPREVMSAERWLRRQLNQAQRKYSNALRSAEHKPQ